tara:strand:+ start:5267 stop:5551 length:285 start_codon:yes stop_codon:yes gene_type:complete
MKRNPNPYEASGIVLNFRKDDISTDESLKKAFFENIAHASASLMENFENGWKQGWRPNIDQSRVIISNESSEHEDFDVVIKWTIHAVEEDDGAD